ncbi:hypothetical protein CO675_11990 [Bradyrhizobium sp. C9]|nr:hypothetical protein CO675_11990 [Bradyrhizobium sp. C9]
MRAWCAVYQWPSKKEFLFGTVLVRPGAPDQEAEAALAQRFTEKWGEILPDDVPRPKLIRLVPGTIWFVPEEEQREAA